jgi:3-dehydroquinate dehydratase-1
MTTRPPVKAQPFRPLVVGVLASWADFQLALQLPKLPDLLELRLDHFWAIADDLENKLSMLAAPLIITARDPREGGANNLSIQKRRELLFRFLPRARYVDVELRSVNNLRALLARARRKNVRCILSFHDLNSTPPVRTLHAIARAAKSYRADIFKVATRTDSPDQLARLLDFFTNHDVDLAVSAMGLGKLGAKSRRKLMRQGSVLNYAHLGCGHITGQPSLSEIRRWALATAEPVLATRRVRPSGGQGGGGFGVER